MATHRTLPRRAQSGATIVVTLILLVVMLLGGIAVARITEVGTLAAGNAAFHEAAVQASEVGVNTAFAAVRALANEEVDAGTWYRASTLPVDASNNLPTGVAWDGLPEITVGAYSVRYVVDRLCTGAMPVTDAVRQCLNKSVKVDESSSVGAARIDPPSVKQFRITVRVTGPKNTQAWVQSLMTRG